MNKILLDGAQGKCVLCILEPGNIHRLKLGQPIEFSLNAQPFFPQGLPAKLSIAIGYSDTPLNDASQLAKAGFTITNQRTPQIEKTVPHCPECKSTVEQLGVQRSDNPVWLIFCPVCGCTLGAIPPQESLRKA